MLVVLGYILVSIIVFSPLLSFISFKLNKGAKKKRQSKYEINKN